MQPLNQTEQDYIRRIEEQTVRRESEKTQQRLLFLAEASKVLGDSLDYETTLQNLSQLAVPALADWCTIDIIESDHKIRSLGATHNNPVKQLALEELTSRYWPEFNNPQHIISRVMRKGQSEVVFDYSPDILGQIYNPEHRKLLTQLGINSLIIVPLIARQQVLGAMMLITADEKRRYSSIDVEIAEELARRAALAIDNARLYQQSQAESLARQQAVEALRQSEAQLRLITDALPVLISYVDSEGCYRFNNKAYEDWWALPPSNLLGKKVSEMLDKESYERLKLQLERVLAGQNVTFENRIEHQDGKLRDVEVTLIPDTSTGGKVSGYIGLVSDMTAHKQAEKALRDSEERLRLASEAGGLGTWEWNMVTGEVQWSDNLEPLHGLAPGSFGKTVEAFFQLIHPDDQTRVAQALDQAIATHCDYNVEFRSMRPDGRLQWIGTQAKVFFNESGQPLRMVGVTSDVTARKLADEALRESEIRFRTMADNAPVLLWVSGTDALCNYFNQRWLDFTGRTMEQELGNGWTEGVHPNDFQACLDTYLTAFTARQPFEMEYRLRRHDNEYRWIFDRGMPRFTPAGTFAGYIGSCIDITERRQTEEERNQLLEQEQAARREAQAAIKVRDEFLSVAAHELKTPITNLRGYTQLVNRQLAKDKVLNAERVERAMTVINQQATKLARLVDQLLDVTRLEVGRFELQKQVCDITALVESVITNIQVTTSEHTLTLHADAPVMVEIDTLRIEQVVNNLLNNAIKYSPKGGQIDIEVKTIEAAWVQFSVSDQGIGIESEHRAYIFERFYQAHPGDRTVGVGLGLYVSRQIIESHNGQIEAEFPASGGTRFVVTLPVTAANK